MYEGTDKDPEPELSIVVPTYNERKNVGVFLLLLDRTFSRLKRGYECIVVDGGSSDGTDEVVQRLRFYFGLRRIKLLRRPRRSNGIAKAIKDGVQLAKTKYIVLMDTDMSHNPEEIPFFMEKMEETKVDILLGSRYIFMSGVGGWHFRRRIFGRLGNLVARALLRTEVVDLLSTFRMYRAVVLKDLLEKIYTQNYCYQAEIIKRAELAKYKILEIPILWVRRAHGRSKHGMIHIFLFFWILMVLAINTYRK